MCFSCVPQPSSAGCSPSDTKPSTDQVLTKTPCGFGVRARCVSRSAMWIPVTPSAWARRAQPSRDVGGRGSVAEVGREVEERALDEPRDHARVRAAARHRRRSRTERALEVEHRLAQRVVRALGHRQRRVGVEAPPGLGDGVDIKRADLAAEPHHRRRRHLDRQVDEERAAATGGQQRLQEFDVVVPGDVFPDEADRALVEQATVLVLRVDHDHARTVEREVPLDERQHAPADGSEADHDERSVDVGVDGVVGHVELRAGRARG